MYEYICIYRYIHTHDTDRVISKMGHAQKQRWFHDWNRSSWFPASFWHSDSPMDHHIEDVYSTCARLIHQKRWHTQSQLGNSHSHGQNTNRYVTPITWGSQKAKAARRTEGKLERCTYSLWSSCNLSPHRIHHIFLRLSTARSFNAKWQSARRLCPYWVRSWHSQKCCMSAMLILHNKMYSKCQNVSFTG